jgi:hypothetical protein
MFALLITLFSNILICHPYDIQVQLLLVLEVQQEHHRLPFEQVLDILEEQVVHHLFEQLA